MNRKRGHTARMSPPSKTIYKRLGLYHPKVNTKHLFDLHFY